MQKGRFYLLVLGLAGVLTMGPATGYSQAGVDATAVNARASAVLADIEGRIGNAKSDDTKKCLRDKRSAVNAIKSRVAGAADLSSLMSELNAVGGELDACNSGADKTDKDKDKGGSGTGAGGADKPAEVEMKVEEGTPGAEDSNPSVIIAPGPTAQGPGVVDNGTSGGGGDLGGGGTGGGDTGTVTPIPVVPPPPISPMI